MEIRIDPDNDSIENLKLIVKILDAKIIDKESFGVDKDIIETLKNTLIELEEKSGMTIPVASIIEEMEDKDIILKTTRKALEQLKCEGYIFEPRRGFVQRVK